MSPKRLLILTLLILSLSALSFASLINPTAASLDLVMNSNAGCGTVTDTGTASWTGTPTLLMTSADAVATCTGPNRGVETRGVVGANWNSPDSGTIRFNNIGWRTRNVSNGFADATQGVDFTYTFVPNQTIWFGLQYDITGGGDLGGFGLNGFSVTLTNFNFLDLNTSGTLKWLLLAGNSYTLTIENGANIAGALGTITESMDGTFRFDSRAVPEPSSLLMLGTGALALAGSLRKKLIG
jgi:hypothetical protein